LVSHLKYGDRDKGEGVEMAEVARSRVKVKPRIEVDALEADAEPTVLRNEEGYWRVRHVDVSMKMRLREPTDGEKVKRRLEIFEKYCVVAGPVRSGIPVNVSVDSGGVK